jgi:hypothetical protein
MAKKAAKKRSRRPKSATVSATNVAAAVTDVVMPVLVPRENGRGALLTGGVPGNAGGGRPRSEVKALATAKLPRHVNTLDGIAEGIAYVTMREKCKKCGHEETGNDLTIANQVKPGEQVRAVEALAKLADPQRAGDHQRPSGGVLRLRLSGHRGARGRRNGAGGPGARRSTHGERGMMWMPWPNQWHRHSWRSRTVTFDDGLTGPCCCSWWRRLWFLVTLR